MLSGWSVAREIPFDNLAGLITGQYKLYGGVIHRAAGTPGAGQIVKHLIFASLSPLGVIPGLNFIPGIVNSWQINEIKNIQKDVKAIKHFLV